MRGCNRVPGGQAKHNSFNLFCKLKLFHLHNVCTFPLSLLLLQFLVSFPSVSSCIFPLCAPLSLFDSVFLSEINFTKYLFFCKKKRTGFTVPSRELLCHSFNLRPFMTHFLLRTKLQQENVSLSVFFLLSHSVMSCLALCLIICLSCSLRLWVSMPVKTPTNYEISAVL